MRWLKGVCPPVDREFGVSKEHFEHTEEEE
jgi:hypothetical protein